MRARPASSAALSPFFLYVSYRRGRARIHRADCGFCKHGKGARGREPPSGRSPWIGPYLTLAGARMRLEQEALWLRENSPRGRELRDVQLCAPGRRSATTSTRTGSNATPTCITRSAATARTGRGIRDSREGRRTITMRWHGPFRTVEQAWRRAQRTGYANVRLHGCASWRD